MTSEELMQQLEDLKKGLEGSMAKQAEEKIRPLKADLDATVKALDILQIRMKNAPKETPGRISLKSQVGTSLEKNIDAVASFIRDGSVPLSIPIASEFETKSTTLGANYTGGSAALNSQPGGIVGSVSRFIHLRDLLPIVQMDRGSLPIIKDGGTSGPGFGFVSEAAQKPALDFILSESPAIAQTLAVIVSVSKQFLDDLGAVGIIGWLTERLTSLYLNAEDNGILNGTGVSPQIQGMNMSGNFTAAPALSSENDVIQMVKAIVQMRTLERSAQAFVIHPADLTRILLNTAGGSGEFDLPNFINVNGSGGISILDTPVIDTVAQNERRFNLVASDGMMLGIRENLNVRFFETSKDDIEKNMITIRAESRIAYANYSPYNIIQGQFEDAGSGS